MAGTTDIVTLLRSGVQAINGLNEAVQAVFPSSTAASLQAAAEQYVNNSSGGGLYISVKNPTYGAKGDGSTNDTAAIMAADAAARAAGATLFFPAGVYMVSQLVVSTGTNWLGELRGAPSTDTTFTAPTGGTIIRQIIGSNTDLLYGSNSNANWGSGTPTGFPSGFALRSLVLDGNWNNGTGNTAGSGLAFFGDKVIVQDVFICNCATHGIRSGWIASNSIGSPGFGTWTMEGYYSNIKIDTVGEHGWWDAGPHDSTVIGCIVIDAGRAASNTYDGFLFDVGSSGLHVGSHAWTRHATAGGASVWTQYAGNCSGTYYSFVGCQFEGALTAALHISGGGPRFDTTCQYYGAGGGTTVYFTGACSGCILRGLIDGPASGAPAPTGVLFDSASSITDCIIDVDMLGQSENAIDFSSATTGGNVIHVRSMEMNGAATFNGNPANSDDFQLFGSNGNGQFRFKNGFEMVGLPTSSGVNVTNVVAAVLSLALPTGVWEVRGIVNFLPAAGSSITDFASALNTSVALPTGDTGQIATDTMYPGKSWNGTDSQITPAGTLRYVATVPTTVYLVASCSVVSGSAVAGGHLSATRV